MEALVQRYVKEVEDSYYWDKIKEEAIANKGYAFLGTVMNIYPSGKFYTPWARSNVDLCPVCKGECSIKNAKPDPKKVEGLYKERASITTPLIQQGKLVTDWDMLTKQRIKKIDSLILRHSPTTPCKKCGGVGSAKAYRDGCYEEALQAVAEKHGGSITEGEGDMCDVFFYIDTGENEDE